MYIFNVESVREKEVLGKRKRMGGSGVAKELRS